MDANHEPRSVLVHDWLTGMRGGEKCLEVLCRRWPSADLYTLLHKPGTVAPTIERRPIHTSFLKRLPGVERYYRYLLPFMPAAVERWRLLGPITAMNGVLLFGWSTAVIFEVLRRAIARTAPFGNAHRR